MQLHACPHGACCTSRGPHRQAVISSQQIHMSSQPTLEKAKPRGVAPVHSSRLCPPSGRPVYLLTCFKLFAGLRAWPLLLRSPKLDHLIPLIRFLSSPEAKMDHGISREPKNPGDQSPDPTSHSAIMPLAVDAHAPILSRPACQPWLLTFNSAHGLVSLH